MARKHELRMLVSLIFHHHGRCFYCGGRVTKARRGGPPARPADATKDHVRPRSLGGSSDPGNLVLACLRCNHLKGNMTLPVFVVMIHTAPRIDMEDRRCQAG